MADGNAGADLAVAKRVREAAERALNEARLRRSAAGTMPGQPAPKQPREIDGRGGPEPVRYGDWEIKGLASDF